MNTFSGTKQSESEPQKQSNPIPQLTINPEFVSSMTRQGIIGFRRSSANQNQILRFYPINLDVFRDSISELLAPYLTIKMSKQNKWSPANISTEIAYLTPLIRDACCTALYARLRPVHLSLTDYTDRFKSASVYKEDLELPPPLADAIQNFGPFNPTSILSNYYCVPVYPENTQNEGRGSVDWCPAEYEAIIPRLKELGIPFRSVDTSVEYGTAWWCYRLKKFGNGSFDLVCLYPPINYSDHSAIVASMFIMQNADGTQPRGLIGEVEGDQEWPTRLRNVPLDFKLRSFSALCHDPREEWDEWKLV